MKEMHKEQMLLLRRILGILCCLLPVACIGFGLFGIKTNPAEWWTSISATYYANSKICMIGLLFSTSVFFFSYKGYDLIDRITTLVAAITSLGVAVFPCKMDNVLYTGLFNLPITVSNVIHTICALSLFTSFWFMVRFAFTRGNDIAKKKKFLALSGIMLGAVLLLFISKIPIIIPETILLECFGIAWLIKSTK